MMSVEKAEKLLTVFENAVRSTERVRCAAAHTHYTDEELSERLDNALIAYEALRGAILREMTAGA